MSREAYQVPTNVDLSGSGGAGAGGSGTAGGAVYGSSDLSAGPVTQYQCGDCAQKVVLRKGDAIRCKECGYRVLYKERTKR